MGPDPSALILAGLVGCTRTTLRRYVQRTGRSIDDIGVDASLVRQRAPLGTIIWRTVSIRQSIADEQRDRLLYIANSGPAARLLEREIVIQTVLDGDVP